MDAKRIESRLRLHIANVALAAVGRKEGDLREAKDALLREVTRIVHDAQGEQDRPGESIIRATRELASR
jgi:hypothetical protein